MAGCASSSETGSRDALTAKVGDYPPGSEGVNHPRVGVPQGWLDRIARMVSAGGEDTMPRRNPVKAAAALASVHGLDFQIVGFDIHEEAWGAQLRAMAAAGKGQYRSAAGAAALWVRMIDAVFGRPEGYRVLNEAGARVASGTFGKDLSLPEGSYVLETSFAGRRFSAPLAISTAATTTVLFDASRIARGEASPAAPPGR